MKIDMFTGTTTFEKSSNEIGIVSEELENIYKKCGLLDDNGNITQKGLEEGLLSNEMVCVSPESGELSIEEVGKNAISFKMSNANSDTIYLTKEQAVRLAKFLFLLEGRGAV